MKYAAYEDYKSSASDWLGSVPSHWHVDRLKWSTNGCYNGVWGDDPNDLDDLVCVRVADFDRDRFVVVNNPPTVRAIEAGQRRNRLLQKNDLLIEKSGGGEKQLVGCVVQFTGDFPAVCSNFVARLPIARGCDPRYLTYLHSAIYAARLNYPAIKQTTGIQNLDSGEYLNISAAYPPLDEQQTIARFLDAKTTQVDTLVAQKRQLIAKLKEKRSALIARTVTRGLSPEAAKAAGLEPNPEMKDSGVEWLGKVPKHWSTTRLKYAANRIIDCPHDTPIYDPTGSYLVVRTADIDSGTLDLSRAYRVDESEYLRRIRRAKVVPKDILYGREGERWGYAALAPKETTVCLGQRMMQFQVSVRFDPGFLMWHLNARSVYEQGAVDVTGSTAPHVNVETIRNYLLAEPPLAEQVAIAAFIDSETEQLDGLVMQINEAIARLTEYRQALITSAVTGKIDVRGLA
ncbi:MAG: restriction endonuclease subunit S [Dechloromonas sp.]|nr:restriction endonuclease subunit S [Dechloromonas sp.]